MTTPSPYDTPAPHEHDTLPVSPTHRKLTAARREYVARDREVWAEHMARDWDKLSSGEGVIGLLKDGLWADFSLMHGGIEEISPLATRDSDGGISLTSGAEKLLELNQLDEDRVTICRKSGENSLADTEFREIQTLYENDPYMECLHDVAHSVTETLQQLSPDGLEFVPVRTFDLEDPHDEGVYRYLANQIKPSDTKALGIYGTTLYVQRHDRDDRDEHLYLHTESAQRLLAAFDVCGLPLHESARDELVAEYDKRYGNAYAWMSREIIKMAADREGELLNETAFDAWQQTGQLIPETGDNAADTLITLINQFIMRGDDRSSDFPVPDEAAKLRNDSCKDVEEYFGLAIGEGKLELITKQNKDGLDFRFIEKTHGGRTFLAVDPVKYCGVVFPSGTLWAHQGSNEGFVPLRLTGFCFDAQTAATVYGGDNLYQHESLEYAASVHEYVKTMGESTED